MQTVPWGTDWELARAADESVDWAAVRVTLGFQDGRAGGKAPVNRYFGMCDEPAPGVLRLGPIGMTMMAGPPAAMAAEQVYLRLLEQVRGLQVGDDELRLLDGDGAEVLAFRPAAEPA